MSDKPDYRPRSPDLSAFAAPPPPRPSRLPSFHQEPANSGGYNVQHRGSYDASPYFSPATIQPSTSYFGSQPHAEPQANSLQTYHYQSQTPFGNTDLQYSPPSQRIPQIFSPPQAQPIASSFAHQHPAFSVPQYDSSSPSSTSAMARTRQVAPKSYAEVEESEDDVSYTTESLVPSRPTKKRKSDTFVGEAVTVNEAISTNDPFAGVEVKTKFPVARIKRIMQADDEVGKVAQATPTAVSKALELFMIALVQKGATEARARNSKKVSAAHLKAALMQDQQFDFVWGICEKVQDPGEKRRGVKSEAEDSADEEMGGGKKRKAKRKATKEESD